jgi:hypothetical protein
MRKPLLPILPIAQLELPERYWQVQQELRPARRQLPVRQAYRLWLIHQEQQS